MRGWGANNAFPRTFGGGECIREQEHFNLLDTFAPGWDDAADTLNDTECYALAVGISMLWAINARLTNEAIPLRMLGNLTTWEEATGLRPAPADLAGERRRRVAAKLRGLAGNAMADIEDACSTSLGANFVQLNTVDVADLVVYWPGINPGPPGFEWSTNKAIVAVVMTKDGLSDAAFQDKRAACSQMLDGLLPAWMRHVVAVGTAGFVVNVGIVGETFL